MIRRLLQQLADAALEMLGIPLSLQKATEKNPSLRAPLMEPATSIWVSSIMPWHNLAEPPFDYLKRGTLPGWGRQIHGYLGHNIHRNDLENIATCTINDNWECDIQDIQGLATSKSDMYDFSSLDELAEKRSEELISPVTEEMLAKNLAHDEIRIIHRKDTTDHFARFLWDNRVFLMNCGGSHHFAAARYIAARLNKKVPLRGKLYTYSLDPIMVDSLLRDFDIYIISDVIGDSYEFTEALHRFEAAWYWMRLPGRYFEQRAILFPRAERRSVIVSDVLREKGFFDLGAHLRKLLEKQATNRAMA